MRVPKEIFLVNQPDDKSCVLACIAMLAGKSFNTVLEVSKKLRIEAPLDNFQFLRIITYFRIMALQNSINEELEDNCLYKVCVPSLNSRGGLHSILIDTRNNDCAKVYDPQHGREGKKYYTFDNLRTYSAPIKILDIRHGSL